MKWPFPEMEIWGGLSLSRDASLTVGQRMGRLDYTCSSRFLPSRWKQKLWQLKKFGPPGLLGMLPDSHARRFNKKAVLHFLLALRHLDLTLCKTWGPLELSSPRSHCPLWQVRNFSLPLALLLLGRQPHRNGLSVGFILFLHQPAGVQGWREGFTKFVCALILISNRMACMLKPAKTIGFTQLNYLYLPSINEFQRAKTHQLPTPISVFLSNRFPWAHDCLEERPHLPVSLEAQCPV